ncbi:MAG TPA: hypothetical protein VF791_07890 [Pyrinomonadaceae bacterium]
MKFTKIAVLLPACLLVVGCSKSANTTKTGGNTTTATTNATKNTAAATPSPQATPQATNSATEPKPHSDMAATPEEAAKGLFNAFGRQDRAAAAKFASEAAVAKLFKESTGTEGMEFQGCNDEGGDLTCAWSYEGGGLIMHIKGSQSGGYMVESIEFIAD